LLNASVGVERVLGRLRRPSSSHPAPATNLQTRSLAAARHVRAGLGSAAVHARLGPHRRARVIPVSLPRIDVRAFVHGLGHEKSVGVAVAAIVLGASVLSISPGARAGSGGDTGGPRGDGEAPRLAIGGSLDEDDYGSIEDDYIEADFSSLSAEAAALAVVEPTTVEGPFLDDGTLLKPIAVNTTVADGRDLVRRYKVKAGDTLTGIASKFDVSMMTLWWANNLKNKHELHQGQILKIPPVSGLVVKVKATDTLATLAKKYKVKATRIVKVNGLEDEHLVVGQVLVVPGAKGEPIPTPKPTKSSSSNSRPRSGGTVRSPKQYNGGRFGWPTSSHHISQYYHYGHYGIDIDGSTGNPIYAAAGGTVTFAGWKSNGGGYQVWISHGSGLYTTYNHMSSVSVGRGQHVGRGQRVGRMGATGFATGSHLHFEVWRGPIWNGGRRVNPLGYL
jgi:murein DD-endopeptidase MepM/ murein hydrolase activator NlpD